VPPIDENGLNDLPDKLANTSNAIAKRIARPNAAGKGMNAYPPIYQE
jgi:hypothetical protein